MLDKRLIEENNFEGKDKVLMIPYYVVSTKESQALYKLISKTLKHFDRSFNNTVVDTYAFNKVLKSKKLVNVIYYYLMQNHLNQNLIKKSITLYVLAEVELIYKKTRHKIFKPEVYLDYIDHLLDRILLN